MAEGGLPMTTGLRIVLLITALLAVTSPAFAVDAIVVTAQRREEPLQDVPLAVSAFNADGIERLQIDRVQDIGENVPNLQTYTVTAGAEAIQIHSRGASIQNPGLNLSESPVGFYEDEIYRGRMGSVNLDLTDVERIEVLRGPQGTLYGRNTIAGAVKIVTRTPGNDPWINASLGLGNYDTIKMTGSVGGAIKPDTLAGSIAVVFDKRNQGWQNNPITGTQPGEYDNKAARGKLHWYGTENLDAVLTVWGVDVENDGFNGVPYTPFSNPDPDGPASFGENFLPAPAGSQPLGDFYGNFSPAGVNYGESTQGGASLLLRWQIGGITLRSITGWSSIDDKFGFDMAGGGFDSDVPADQLPNPGAPGLLIRSDSTLDQLSQEFQLLGDAMGNRLRYLIGLSYLNEDGSQTFGGDLTTFASLVNFNEQIGNETNSYAVFAEGTYKLTEKLSVTAGGRWTKDEKEFHDTCTDTGPTLQGCQPANGATVHLDESWDEFNGKVGLDYRLSAASLVYLNWSQGYQSGGFQSLCFGDLTAACGATPYDPQTVDSFELGYKADLFDRRLRFNTAAFYAMYDDVQQVVIPAGGVGTNFPTGNIGEVDVYGVEVELQWTPVENFRLFASAGYQQSDFGSVDPASPLGGLNGNAPPTDELPSNPRFQGKIGFDYSIPMPEAMEFFYGADVFHSDKYFSEARNLVKIDSYTRVNGFFGIGEADGSWQIVLSGRNIANTENNVSGIFAQGFTNVRTPLPPVEYMLTFKVNL